MTDFPTLESCFAEVASRGCMVNNLQQLGPDQFRASLRKTLVGGNAVYSGYSEGRTPLEAFRKVLTEHPLLREPKRISKKIADLL